MDKRPEDTASLPTGPDSGWQPSAHGAQSSEFEEWLNELIAAPATPGTAAQAEQQIPAQAEQSIPVQAEPPIPVQAEPPIPVQAEQPIPVQAEPQIPAQAEQQIPAQAEQPIPVQAEQSIHAQAEPPIPVQAEPPIPVQAEPPIPVQAEPQIPAQAEQQIPAQAEQPIPAQAEQPIHAQAEQPIPAQAEQPIPVQAEQPIPAQAEQPIPVQAEQPIPAQAEQPIPTQAEQGVPTQADLSAPTHAPAKKKSKKGLLIGLLAGAVALLAAAAVFLLTWFSADARFDRAMKAEAYETAEEILRSGALKASAQNDAHYLALAEREMAKYQSGAVDYKTAAEYILALESAKLCAEQTRQTLEGQKNAVVGAYLGELSGAYDRGQSDYGSTMQALLALKEEAFLDEALRGQVESRLTGVVEAHLGSIYSAYRSGELSYEEAVAQLGASNPFGEALAAESIDRYLAKMDEARQSLYVDAIGMIEAQEEYGTEDLLAALEPFASYRNADALLGILGEIREGDCVEAAKQLLAWRDAMETADDALREETSSTLFDALKSRILHVSLNASTDWDDYAGKLDLRIRSDYTDMLFGEPSNKYTTLFGGESSRALSLSKTLDLGWFSSCKGGTGKILYVAHYLNSSSGDSYDTYYYYRYENLEDLPIERMPESLEDVEYLVLFEQGGKYYSSYSYSDGSGTVTVYIRTIQVKVLHFPSGEVIYDSGVLTGPTPPSTMSVFSGTKYAYGDDPDLSAVTEKVKELIGLS